MEVSQKLVTHLLIEGVGEETDHDSESLQGQTRKAMTSSGPASV